MITLSFELNIFPTKLNIVALFIDSESFFGIAEAISQAIIL